MAGGEYRRLSKAKSSWITDKQGRRYLSIRASALNFRAARGVNPEFGGTQQWQYENVVVSIGTTS